MINTDERTPKEVWVMFKLLIASINMYIADKIFTIRKFITGKDYNKVTGKFLDCSVSFTWGED